MAGKHERGVGPGVDGDVHELGSTSHARALKAGVHEGKYGDGEVWGFTGIFGPTGSGKSTEADRLVSHARRVIKWIPPTVVFASRGWPVFSQPGQLRRFLIERAGKPFQCIYSPSRGGGEMEEHFECVGRLALEAKDLILYIDEVNDFCSPAGLMPIRSAYWSKPENKNRTPVLRELLNYGRHQRVAMVMISRIPAQVNRLLTQSCDEMRVFQQTEPNVVSYFGAVNKHLADMLPTLPRYSFALYQQGKKPVVAGGRR